VEKLNEQTKKNLYIAGGICLILALACLALFLFRDIPNNGTTANDVTEQLDTTAEQQRKAEDTLKSVQSGLDDSERTVDNLDQSNRDAQTTADRITESNTNIANAVSDAQSSNSSSAAILADSQSRIAECESILQEIRAGAGKVTE